MSKGVKISLVSDPASAEAWDKLVDSQSDPNPMMLAGWNEILRNAFNVRPIYLSATREEQLIGAMATYHSRSFWGGNVLRGMDGTIAESESISPALIDKAIDLARERKVSYCHFRCPIANVQGARSELKVHTRVALNQGADSIWNQLSSNTRRKIRKARKNGYEIGVNKRIPTDFGTIYLRRQRDLGTPSPRAEIFEAINVNLSGRLTFISVKQKRKVLGGAVVLRAGGIWLNLYTAVNPEAQRNYASYLLYWNMINHAADGGGDFMDLGRSRSGSGTHRFKLQWASEDLVRTYTIVPVCGRLPAASLDRSIGLKHAIWKRLPIWIAGPVGGYLRHSIPFA